MHCLQRRSWFDAQLGDQPRPHPPVGLQRGGLSAAAVLRQHQLSGDALVEWMSRCRSANSASSAVWRPARSAASLRSSVGREQLGLQRRAHLVHPRRVETGERLTRPQRHGVVERGERVSRVFGGAGGPDQGAEPVQVDRLWRRVQRVAGRPAGDVHGVGSGQRVPEPGHIGRQRITGPVRRFVRPHPLDELVGRHRPVQVDQQTGEHAALSRMPDVEAVAVHAGLDFTEQPEMHPHRGTASTTGAPRACGTRGAGQSWRAPIQCSRSCTISSSSR